MQAAQWVRGDPSLGVIGELGLAVVFKSLPSRVLLFPSIK